MIYIRPLLNPYRDIKYMSVYSHKDYIVAVLAGQLLLWGHSFFLFLDFICDTKALKDDVLWQRAFLFMKCIKIFLYILAIIDGISGCCVILL